MIRPWCIDVFHIVNLKGKTFHHSLSWIYGWDNRGLIPMQVKEENVAAQMSRYFVAQDN
jgi:hypothetical protein